MKIKLLLAFVTLLSIRNAAAQQKKEWRLNFGFQGNIPERAFNKNISRFNNKNGGAGVHLCPTWFVYKNLSLAVNMEYAMVVEDYQTDKIDVFNIISFTPRVRYYFTDLKIRPFAGLGAGFYHVLSHSPKINLGICPVVGINIYDYFELSMEYNKILNNIKINPSSMGAFDNYYLAVKGSFSIGIFGKKPKKDNNPASFD